MYVFGYWLVQWYHGQEFGGVYGEQCVFLKNRSADLEGVSRCRIEIYEGLMTEAWLGQKLVRSIPHPKTRRRGSQTTLDKAGKQLAKIYLAFLKNEECVKDQSRDSLGVSNQSDRTDAWLFGFWHSIQPRPT